MEETTIDEILEAQAGNQMLLNDIVENNSRLVWSIVKRFKNGKVELEDLYQIGAMGLVKSIKRFDKNFNVKLSTFAVPYIVGEIKRFLRDDGFVKVSRSLKELNMKIEMLKREYERQGKELDIEKIEEELKESRENILLALDVENSVKSIDEENEDGSENLYNRIGVASYEDETIRNIILKEELEKLEKMEREIIVLRYFFNHTQNDVAKRFGISQVQVSRVEKKILLKMRENIKEKL